MADTETGWTSSLAAHLFLLEVDGVEIGYFQEVSGIQAEIEFEPIQEGGENEYTRRVPSRIKWSNLVLKSGVTRQDQVFDWFSKTAGDGYAGAGDQLQAHSGAITMVDQKGTRVRSWNFYEAYPVKWTGPQFKVGAKEVPTEELEIAHHGIQPESF